MEGKGELSEMVEEKERKAKTEMETEDQLEKRKEKLGNFD